METVASGVLGIIGVGQQTPLSQGRCCKAKVQEVKCNKCNMDAADRQALNTHTNQIFQWKNLMYLNNPLLYSPITSYLLLLLRAGCLTGLSLWTDGLFDRFLGRPEERV